MDLKHLILLVFYLYVIECASVLQLDPDFGLNAKQLIKKYGYPLEVHEIHTEDGYILETHRIPHGRNDQKNGTRLPILLMPGIVCGSDIWVNFGVQNSLGFILADQGYDVWLANYRGTTWSKKHENLNADTDKKLFFDYSFQEIAAYDLPANIDYILNVTQQENLFYIGHSQGTTSFFAMASSKPEYNSKVRLMVALAPVAYLSDVDHIFFNLMKRYYGVIEEAVEQYEMYELASQSTLRGLLVQILCNDDSAYQAMCAELIYFIVGTSKTFDESIIPVLAYNTPSGTSGRSILHFTQIGMTGTFQQYDFGSSTNLEKYNQTTPPKYNLGKVTTPVALYYGNKDTLSTVKDVERLNSELPNVVRTKSIDDFSHLDFLWSKSIISLVYSNVVELIENLS